jgi:hypothetical protein
LSRQRAGIWPVQHIDLHDAILTADCRGTNAICSSRIQFLSDSLTVRTIRARARERPRPEGVRAHIPQMEPMMINLKVLSTVAAMALVLPMIAPTPSAAQVKAQGAPLGGGGGISGGGMRGGGGGGGAAIAPGGGGGIRAPGSGIATGGVRPGGGTAAIGVRPGVGGALATGPAVSGGGYYHGGGYHHHRHHRHGHGFWPGVAIGAGIASSYAYYGSPYYYDDEYYDEGVVAAAPVGDDSVAYCMQTYRSYDPQSGTYLGYDGQRHPCP